MKTSETIEALAEALAAAQGEMKNATLNRENPHFRSKYADLAGIRDTVMPVLAKHGLSVTQITGADERGNLALFTRLLHKSGQWIEGAYPITLDKPQQMGSQLTYARRYSLSSICGISADEDDDAEIATKNGNGKAAETKPPQQFVTEAQVKALEKALKDEGRDKAKFLDLYGIESLAALFAHEYDGAMYAIKAGKVVKPKAAA